MRLLETIYKTLLRTHGTQSDYWRLMRLMGTNETQGDYWRLMTLMGTHMRLKETTVKSRDQ